MRLLGVVVLRWVLLGVIVGGLAAAPVAAARWVLVFRLPGLIRAGALLSFSGRPRSAAGAKLVAQHRPGRRRLVLLSGRIRLSGRYLSRITPHHSERITVRAVVSLGHCSGRWALRTVCRFARGKSTLVRRASREEGS